MKQSKQLRRSGQPLGSPGLQRSENRQLMAADVGIVDSKLSIEGSDQDDAATVYVDGDHVNVTLTTYDAHGNLVVQKTAAYSRGEIGRIVFQGGSGNDRLVNDASIDSILRGDAGNDSLLGGSDGDLILGGTGNDVILGGGGSDRIDAGPGEDVVMESAVDTQPADQPAVRQLEINGPIDPIVEVSECDIADGEEFGEPTNLGDDEDTTVIDEETLFDLDPENLVRRLGDPTETEPESVVNADESDDDMIFGGSGDDWVFGGFGSGTIFGGTSPLEDELMRSVISGRLLLSRTQTNVPENGTQCGSTGRSLSYWVVDKFTERWLSTISEDDPSWEPSSWVSDEDSLF